MASDELIESHRENAEIYHGEDVCKQKSLEVLEEYSLPKGLVPTKIVELGHNRSSGFVWMKNKAKTEHRFKLINNTVCYDTIVTLFAEKNGVRNLTGVKAKEMFFWVTVSNVFIDDPSSGKIIIVAANGLKRSFPVSAFELDENHGVNQKINGNK